MLKNKIKYSIIAAVSVLLFVFYHNFFFLYLLITVALLPAVSYFLSRRIVGKSSAKVRFLLDTAGPDNTLPVEFTVENKTVFPLPGIELRYKVENNFYPNDEIQLMTLPLESGLKKYNWSIKSVYSGRIRISGMDMSARDYLGMFTFKTDWNCEAEISVVPECSDIIIDLIENTFSDGDEEDADLLNYTEDVSKIKDFREYRPGDRMQRVNWKISAKHDELYVKEFEQEYNLTLTLLVELRRDSEEIGFLDDVISAFYSSALKLTDMDIVFRVMWYDFASKSLKNELVGDSDSLAEVLDRIYMSSGYSGYQAYENYNAENETEKGMALYFTSPSFAQTVKCKEMGIYRERVALVCLF